MCSRIIRICLILMCACLSLSALALPSIGNDTIEPTLASSNVIDLLDGDTLNAWSIPSDIWSVNKGIITGQTGAQKLKEPQWLYTKQAFSDFEFSCELKLTGDTNRNTGIYYRVKRILFKGHGKRVIETPYEAPSGYEFDAAYHKDKRKNFWGALGDWFARPSLRVFADQALIATAYKPEDWNRMTIRARGNRLEYWINGIKLMDYLDHDPNASREGLIGLQIHDGSVMKVEYRNLRVLALKP